MKRFGVFAALVVLIAACGDSGASTSTVPPDTSAATVATTLPTASPTTVPITTTLPETTTTTTTTTTLPPTTLAASDPYVTIVGFGPIRVGMSVEEAREAAPYDLAGELDPTISDSCFYLSPDDPDLLGVAFMVLNDEIARVDVFSPSTVTTRSGAGIGLTDTQIREMFPGRIESAPEATSDGAALRFVPKDEEDKGYGVIFVIVEGKVLTYRAGTVEAIFLQEGCL